MGFLLPVGVGLFVIGLVIVHVVFGLTRGSVRKEQPIPRRLRISMWVAVGLAVLGFAAAAVGFVFGGQ